jgi:hypothetical protein
MADSNQSGPVLRIRYLGDGHQTEFYIPFKIFTPNDVEVYVDSHLETDSKAYPSGSGGTKCSDGCGLTA